VVSTSNPTAAFQLSKPAREQNNNNNNNNNNNTAVMPREFSTSRNIYYSVVQRFVTRGPVCIMQQTWRAASKYTKIMAMVTIKK
jgi:hypothetical protein